MESPIEKSFFIDPHCHMQYFTYEQISRIIKSDNFLYYLSNSTSREDFDTTIEISNKFPQIIPGIGHHPWYLENLISNENWYDEFTNYCEQLSIKGVKYFIGEIGIDGGKPKKIVPLEKQIEIFSKQLEYANEKNKLTTIHCVYEWEKLLKVLDKSSISNLLNNKILLHSFQGSRKIMEKYQKFNPWYSISAGCFIEKNFEMIKAIPLNRLLLESDSPSMFNKLIYEKFEDYSNYIQDEKGNYKNQPSCIIHLAKRISVLRNIEIDEFLYILKKNYSEVINIIN